MQVALALHDVLQKDTMHEYSMLSLQACTTHNEFSGQRKAAELRARFEEDVQPRLRGKDEQFEVGAGGSRVGLGEPLRCSLALTTRGIHHRH